MAKVWLLIAAISGLSAVILGAFGAHALKGKIADNLLQAFQTGNQYQMYHTLALVGLGALLLNLSHIPKPMAFVGYFWVCGMILFSGSLYVLALGGPAWLGPITPIGGLLLILGWLSLFFGIWKI
jgi:uncharacterized membrane protein YgdD (TMEM256/DUF423 family)